LPSFGPYQHERERQIAEAKTKEDILEAIIEKARPGHTTKGPIPAIKDLIAQAIDKIGPYKDLNNKEQVVALIDEVKLSK